jgi:hypothetical protein
MTTTSATTHCPRCQSPRIVFGEVTRGRTLGLSESFGFRAYAARLSAFRKGVAVTPAMCACSHCGLVWGELEPLRLLGQLRQLASAEVQEWLDATPPVPL